MMNDVTGLQEIIALIRKDIDSHVAKHGKNNEKYYKLQIRLFEARKEEARLTNDEWTFNRYYKDDFERKISHAELSIDYLHRWGDACE